MTNDPVTQALAELHDLVRCRCHPAYTGRNLRDPDCECDSAEAVKMVADRIEAQAAEIERLRGDLKKARDVIDWALICWDDHNKHGYNMQGDWVSDARAIVAELTGGKT